MTRLKYYNLIEQVFSIWYKRLEKGRFRLPKMQQKTYTLSTSDFNLLLEGMDLVYRRHVSEI